MRKWTVLLLCLSLCLCGCVGRAADPGDTAPSAAAPGETEPGGSLHPAVEIAPALDMAAVEPVRDTRRTDARFIPDLGYASGFYFELQKYANDHRAQYTYQGPAEDARALIDEYFALLASLPYFEVVDEPSLYLNRFYRSALRYVGTGSVEHKNLDLFCSQPYAVAVYMDEKDCKVLVDWAEGLTLLDTGHRLPGGLELTTRRVYGPRVGDAFYCMDGVYYNGSDQALAARAGSCALLVNGEPFMGTADSADGVRNTVEGFRRVEWVQIYLREHYPQAGDLYNAEDLAQYSNTSYILTYNMVRFALSMDGGENWINPTCKRSNAYRGVTVRVLQLEPEIVMYFYADLTVEAEPYEIEGLFVAAPHSSEPGGGEENGAHRCSRCFMGQCTNCGGSGYVYDRHTGARMACPYCYSGRCIYCGGTGWIKD